jgi:hypothetical protein
MKRLLQSEEHFHFWFIDYSICLFVGRLWNKMLKWNVIVTYKCKMILTLEMTVYFKTEDAGNFTNQTSGWEHVTCYVCR